MRRRDARGRDVQQNFINRKQAPVGIPDSFIMPILFIMGSRNMKYVACPAASMESATFDASFDRSSG